jgi:hypothetical protein
MAIERTLPLIMSFPKRVVPALIPLFGEMLYGRLVVYQPNRPALAFTDAACTWAPSWRT